MSLQIDSHQHFWSVERGDYGWLTPEQGVLYRDFGPADLEPLNRAAGVQRSVLVQAAPSRAETRFLLDIARDTTWIGGVVGWVDMAAADAPDLLEDLARDARLRGIRPMIQDIPDVDWMLGEGLEPAFRALVELDLAFDALVRPVHLPNLLRLLERHSELRVVVDHGAKPSIAQGLIEPWASDLARIANETGTFCKLSGLVTEAGADWTPESLEPYMDRLLEYFGPERLMWGSDWPVVNLARGHASWRELSEGYLSRLPASARDAILGGNAARFYQL
jgi:L-fuconolactonase